MPATCKVPIEPLSTESFSELDYIVMGLAFQCHNEFGRLADERIYETSMATRLNRQSISCSQQVPVDVKHGCFHKTYFLDLLVSRKGVYELKAVTSLNNEHVAQLINYLYLLDLPRGKLINFRLAKVESKFVNAPMSRQERTSFAIDKDSYYGKSDLVELTVDLLRDLGTALSQSLYQEALVALLGGENIASAMLPLREADRFLGDQFFYLAAPREALRITCFSQVPNDYDLQILRLLQLTPLSAIQWINIDVKTVSFRTISRKVC